MKYAVLALALTVAVECCASTALAEGWSWRNWVPFAKKDSNKSASKKSKQSSTWSSDKRFLKGSTSRRASDDSTALSRMTSGTKRFFSNASDRLTFKKIKPARQPVSGMSGTYEFRKQAEKKKSFFTSWLRRDSKSGPRTAQEWQSLQRPTP